MKRILSFCLPSIFSLICTNLAYGQYYQKIADATPWTWTSERASVSDSFLRFPNTYQLELIRPKDKIGIVTIRLAEDGKELYSWVGHYGSVFALSDRVYKK